MVVGWLACAKSKENQHNGQWLVHIAPINIAMMGVFTPGHAFSITPTYTYLRKKRKQNQ